MRAPSASVPTALARHHGRPTGDENTRIYAGPVEGPGTDLRELMPAPRSVAHFAEAVDASSDFIVTSNQRDKKVFDLYRVNPAGGPPVLMATNPGNLGWWGWTPRASCAPEAHIKGDQVLLEQPGAEPGSWVTVAERSRWGHAQRLSACTMRGARAGPCRTGGATSWRWCSWT
ncbi:hypothetical protein [Acidovorax delafieldii]|uniref:hypothetical protein n=1 Tax=Acidovorax delafieldii TaxID=47920 RepID=UPI0037575E7E